VEQPARHLILEVTEQSMIVDLEDSIASMQALSTCVAG
jgi:EAL domain-containing protein (putative c-di-GMP-specific phosphodiesterase class I)